MSASNTLSGNFLYVYIYRAWQEKVLKGFRLSGLVLGIAHNCNSLQKLAKHRTMVSLCGLEIPSQKTVCACEKGKIPMQLSKRK